MCLYPFPSAWRNEGMHYNTYLLVQASSSTFFMFGWTIDPPILYLSLIIISWVWIYFRLILDSYQRGTLNKLLSYRRPMAATTIQLLLSAHIHPIKRVMCGMESAIDQRDKSENIHQWMNEDIPSNMMVLCTIMMVRTPLRWDQNTNIQ